MHPEITKVVKLIRLVMSTHHELLVVLSVRESGETEHAGDVGSRWVTAELIRQRAEQRFRLFLVEAFNAPHDLVLPRRRVDDKIGRRGVAGCS